MSTKTLVELSQAINEAKASGQYAIAVFRIEGGRVHCFTAIDSFPAADDAIACELFESRLAEIRRKLAAEEASGVKDGPRELPKVPLMPKAGVMAGMGLPPAMVPTLGPNLREMLATPPDSGESGGQEEGQG